MIARPYSVQFAAGRLGVSVQTVKRRLQAGEIRGERASDATNAPWRVDGSHVEEICAATGRAVVAGYAHEFEAKAIAAYGPEQGAALARRADDHDTRASLADELAATPAGVEFERAVERVDLPPGPLASIVDSPAFESYAQQLANEMRAHRKLERRAYQIMDEMDDADADV